MNLNMVEVKYEDYLKAASDLYFYEDKNECLEYLTGHKRYLVSHKNDELNKIYTSNPRYIFENSPYMDFISFKEWIKGTSEKLEITLRKALIDLYIYRGYGYILKEKISIDRINLTEIQSQIWYRVPKSRYMEILKEIQSKITEMETTGETKIPYLEYA